MNTSFRILSAIGVASLLIWGQWWIVWPLIIVFLFIFPTYYEIIFWGVMYDALYGLSVPQFWNIPFVFSILSIVLFILSQLLRKLLLAYEPTI
jgi:hypothetical protein